MRNYSWDARGTDTTQNQQQQKQAERMQSNVHLSVLNSCEKQNTLELTNTNYFLQRSKRKQAKEHNVHFCSSPLYICIQEQLLAIQTTL